MTELDPDKIIDLSGAADDDASGEEQEAAEPAQEQEAETQEQTEPDKQEEPVEEEQPAEEEQTDTQEQTEDKTQAQPEKDTVDESAVTERLTAIEDKLKALEKSFDEKIEHTAYEEKIVDRMHDELQDYKQDLYLKIMKPLINEIIGIRDNILKNAESYRQNGGENPSVPLKTFETYAYDMEDALTNCNVEIFRDSEGDDFDPKRMRVVKKVDTDDESLHGKVAKVVNDGYRYESILLSPEKVEVYFFKKAE